MTEQTQTQDNFWIYIGGFIAAILVLVLIFKSTHNEAIPTAYEETAKQVDAQIAKQHQNK